jgi:hypothetical protein
VNTREEQKLEKFIIKFQYIFSTKSGDYWQTEFAPASTEEAPAPSFSHLADSCWLSRLR